MAELELKRAPGERRLYTLDGVGSIRFAGLLSRNATAESNGERWQFERRGLLGRRSAAFDEAGAAVGRFEPRDIRRGGAITWRARELTLRPASAWRERYALADGETELALLDGKAWGRRPGAVSSDDPAALERGLLLFAAFVVRGLAERRQRRDRRLSEHRRHRRLTAVSSPTRPRRLRRRPFRDLDAGTNVRLFVCLRIAVSFFASTCESPSGCARSG